MKTRPILACLLVLALSVCSYAEEYFVASTLFPTNIMRGKKAAIGLNYRDPLVLPDDSIPASSIKAEAGFAWGPLYGDLRGLFILSNPGLNIVTFSGILMAGGWSDKPIFIGPSTTMVNNSYLGDVKFAAGAFATTGVMYFGTNPGIITGKIPVGSGKLEATASADTGNVQGCLGSSSPPGPYMPGEAPVDEIYIGGTNIEYVRIEAPNYFGPVASATSDITLKKDIVAIPDALDKVCRLRGVNFRWKDKKRPSLGMGLIGQEVERVFPEVVNTDKNGIKSVQYDALIGALVEAMKDRQKEIDALKKKLELIESNKNNPKKAAL